MTSQSLLQEIRERQRVEQELRESEARVRAILDSALSAVVVINAEGRIIDWNTQASAVFGWTRAEALGRELAETIIPPRYREAHQRGLGHFLATGEGPVLHQFIELSALRRDGSEFPVELSISPLKSGDVITFCGFVSDITQRKRAEAALLESEERLRKLAESLPHLVWTCGPDGRCDYLSRQWVEYTGRPEAEQLGYGWAEQIHPDDRERAQAEWVNATVRGDFFDIEFRIRRADGVFRWFKTRAVPLRDGEGQIVKWFGSNTDFEDYKQSEDRLRTQLARLNLLDRTTRAIGERQDLRSIFQVVVRSLEDHLPIDFGCVCLHDPAQQTLTIDCVGIKSRSLALELAEKARIDIDRNGLSPCVRGQMIYDPDMRRVEFTFQQRLARAGLRSLRGCAAGRRARRFRRDGGCPGERGTGLGLAMVYGMVQRHGAQLEIDSAPGQGTTMRLIFTAPAEAASPNGLMISEPRPAQRLRILLIDDDPLLLESLKIVLEADGHVIVMAEGGQAGIDSFHIAEGRQEPFAAVFTDLGMPHVDGRQVASAIKATSPDTPIIMLTGWGHRLLATGDMPEHVDRVIDNPPRLAELRVALAELTGKRTLDSAP